MERMKMMLGYWAALIVTTGTLANPTESNVTSFLQNRQLVAPTSDHPPVEWSETENIEWKTDLPGLAWASPIVWNDRVYLTTCVRSGAEIEPKKGLYIEDLDARKYPKDEAEHEWKTVCLDLKTGSIIWERRAHAGVPAKPHHIKNTLASETPCTDGERLYVCFGNVGLYTYDMDGELLWSHAIEPKETRYGWGTSQSPIVKDGVVYLCLDNEEDSHLLAFDAKTGKILWDVTREEKTNYSTPFIWSTPTREELVVSGIGWCQSYDLKGNPLWKIKGRSILAIPTPFEHDGLLYVTSGHVAWGENPIYCVKPGASGDLSPTEGQPLSPHLAWHQEKGGPYHPTPIIIDDVFYVLLDRGFLSAYDAKTGEPIYLKQRIPNGRAFTSSPWSYDGKLFALNEDGVTFTIATGPDFEILGRNLLATDDMCMATPVIVGDRLLVRTSARIYSIKQD